MSVRRLIGFRSRCGTVGDGGGSTENFLRAQEGFLLFVALPFGECLGRISAVEDPGDWGHLRQISCRSLMEIGE